MSIARTKSKKSPEPRPFLDQGERNYATMTKKEHNAKRNPLISKKFYRKMNPKRARRYRESPKMNRRTNSRSSGGLDGSLMNTSKGPLRLEHRIASHRSPFLSGVKMEQVKTSLGEKRHDRPAWDGFYVVGSFPMIVTGQPWYPGMLL